MFKHKIYRSSPIWAQEVLIASKSALRNVLRRNRHFRRTLTEIEQTQWLDPEALRKLQTERLRALLQHAVRNVPFYRERFGRDGLRVDDISTLEDIKRLPFLAKRDVLNDGAQMVARNASALRFSTRTSGTTGTPLTIRYDQNGIIREHAFKTRQLLWAGYQPGERMGWIRGDMIVPASQVRVPFWRYDRVDDVLMMSSYHISEERADEYISALETFDPSVIKAYPSSISFLARHLENRGRRYMGNALRSVITSSETLDDEQRRAISEYFRCNVFDWYGNVENVAAIGTCEHGTYHVIEDYGLLEFMDNGDGTAEIVGTGFNNWAMPLVRYRTDDRVVIQTGDDSCRCGRSFRTVKSILGRADDYIKMKDGRHIGRMSRIIKETNHVAEAQIIQTSLQEIDVLVVPFQHFSQQDRDSLIAAAGQYLGEEMRVNIRTVSAIPRTANGKFRSVICRV